VRQAERGKGAKCTSIVLLALSSHLPSLNLLVFEIRTYFYPQYLQTCLKRIVSLARWERGSESLSGFLVSLPSNRTRSDSQSSEADKLTFGKVRPEVERQILQELQSLTELLLQLNQKVLLDLKKRKKSI